MNSPESKTVEIHTDGACRGNPGPGGWGALLRYGQHERELGGGEPATTNNRMELMAAIAALESLTRPCEVVLFTDSQYVRQGSTEWMPGWLKKDFRRGKNAVKNVDLWKALYELTQLHDMSYEHVRGHSGHPENEACDQLAVAEIEKIRGVS